MTPRPGPPNSGVFRTWYRNRKKKTAEVKNAQPRFEKNRGCCVFALKSDSRDKWYGLCTTFSSIHGKEDTMQWHYSRQRLTAQEWMEIDEILLDELDIQCWYGVTFLSLFGGETLVTLQ